jgi:hypothetical protein
MSLQNKTGSQNHNPDISTTGNANEGPACMLIAVDEGLSRE